MSQVSKFLAVCLLLLFFRCLPAAAEKIEPPWVALPKHGINFTIPGIDNVPDLHGEIERPDLVVFFAGNQFMVVPDLLDAFKRKYPQYQRIYVETLPPGILDAPIEREDGQAA